MSYLYETSLSRRNQYCKEWGGEAVFSQLSQYFEEEFCQQNNKHLKDKMATGFENIDRLLNGGFGQGHYVLLGKKGDERRTLLSHLAEQMARNGNFVILLTQIDYRLQLLNQMIVRQYFRSSRNEGKEIEELVIANDIKKLKCTKAVEPLLNYIAVENSDELDVRKLEERLVKQKQVIPKLVLLLDVQYPSYYMENNLLYQSNHFNALYRISRNLQIPIISVLDITRNDFETVKKGFSPYSHFDLYVDNVLILDKDENFSVYGEPSCKNESLPAYLLNLTIRNPIVTKTTYLTYFPTRYYFQDA